MPQLPSQGSSVIGESEELQLTRNVNSTNILSVFNIIHIAMIVKIMKLN